MLCDPLALLLAIGLSPWLISRLLLPRQSRLITIAGWGPAMIALNIGVPITLHLLAIPITPSTLALAHTLIFSLLLMVALPLLRQKQPNQPPLAAQCQDPANRIPLATLLLFALLVIPFGHIAGIDTYKWQDLAGNVAVEQRISWLIHPLSLLGFTPRSYSSAQPLVLATIQILGHTGIDWGFYLLSITFGLTGFAGARLLGRHLFPTGSSANWLAALYLLSPVFMRYNYWATGRGLMIALLPVYLLVLLKLGHALTASRLSSRYSLIPLIPAWLALSALLMLSHKAGVVGAILIPVLLMLSPALRLLYGRWGLWSAGVIVLGLGLLLTGGQPVSLVTRLVTRFGWLLPLALLAFTSSPAALMTPPFRTLTAGGLATLVLSCTPDMYGALLALPFVTCIAAVGLEKIKWRPAVILGLIALPALVIVINQTRDSPGDDVYRAAQFIEQHDPRGPFRLEAPGAARRQIQAYVSGCPRFTVQVGTETSIRYHPLPPWSGNLAQDARVWIDTLRRVVGLHGSGTDWYGEGAKVYYITIGGEGHKPPRATPLFTSGSVTVFE